MSEETKQEDTSAKSEQSEVDIKENIQADVELEPSEPLDVDGENQVEELQQKLITLGEQLLREQAEMQNVRRRAERDVEKCT